MISFDSIRRLWIQSKMIMIRNGWEKAEFLKKIKVFHRIGEHCFYQSVFLPAEPFLVSLHNNVVISAGVRLATHSAAHTVFNYEDKTDQYVCQHGKIEIHDNVYIGAGVIINMGVTIHENCIVAAGAVVTKDVPSGSVVAGIPARVIESYEDAKRKALGYSKKFTNVGFAEPCTVEEMLQYLPANFDDRKELS